MESVLARNCTRLRKERGFRSREAFSEFADIPFPTYRSIESGLTWPEKPNVEKIAKAFGVSEATLFADPDLVEGTKPTKLKLFEIVATLDDETQLQALLSLAQKVKREAAAARPEELKPQKSKKSSG